MVTAILPKTVNLVLCCLGLRLLPTLGAEQLPPRRSTLPMFPVVARTTALLGLLAITTATTAGCARRGLVQKEMSDSEARVLLVGRSTPRIIDIDADGFETKDKSLAVSQEAEPLIPYAVHTDSVLNGLGIGGLRNTPEAFGPVLVLGDDVLARTPAGWTDRGTSDFFATVYGGPMPQTHPTAEYTIQGGSKGLSLNDVYRRLFVSHAGPVFVVGEGHFAALAPVEGEPAPTPAIAAKPYAVFAAIVARDEVQMAEGADRALQVPADADTALDEVSRTHVGVLDKRVKLDLRRLDGAAANVQSIVVAEPNGSRIISGRILVYQIAGFREP